MNDFSVLVVDDEADFVEGLSRRLLRRGVRCDGALCGSEAARKMAARKVARDDYGVVLLDMLLPDMDGNAVLQHIREHHPGTPVVVLTGHASARKGHESLSHGAVDYLMKPVELETLYEKLSAAWAARTASHCLNPPEGVGTSIGFNKNLTLQEGTSV